MMSTLPSTFFNPDLQVRTEPLANGQCCYVIDDALAEPERLLAWASEQRMAFKAVDFSAYPGRYLLLPSVQNAAIEAFFQQRMRPLFDARRLMSMHARLAMVTLPPEALRPAQWICHSDHFGLESWQSIQASVLYLFDDEALGGTGFYAPRLPPEETSGLFRDAIAMSGPQFTERYGIESGYLCESNPYFQRIGGVRARWNRMVFYDGTILHTGDIHHPERLSNDPAHGRLTLNGFFTSRRRSI